MSERVAEVVKREESSVILNGQNGRYTQNGTKKDHLSTKPPQEDPFDWGWRESTEILPDGRMIEKRIPLTLEDMLHPQEGDIHMQEEEHSQFCSDLYHICQSQLRDVDGSAFYGTRLDWGHPHVNPHAPDISVFFSIPKGGQRTTLYVQREQAQPALCIEITSKSTRINDVTTKVGHYEQVGVPVYVIVDRSPDNQTDYELVGYELTSMGYQEMQPDSRGYLWLDAVQLWLGLEENQLVYLDKDNNPIGNFDQQRQRADAEHVRANQAEERAEKAEEQITIERQRTEKTEEQLTEATLEIARLRALLAVSGIEETK